MAGGTGSRNAAPVLSVRPGAGYAAMMRSALLVAGMLLSLVAEPQEIYRWVDKDGIVHYADQPGAPDAKRVELVGLSTYEAAPAAREYSGVERQPAIGAVYESLFIVQPARDETFFGAGVTVPVVAELVGRLQPGHTLVFFLDGNRVSDTGGFSAQLSGLDRGMHFLRAAVLDDNGSPVITSPQITFHVRQPSVKTPQSPQAPRPPPKSKPPASSAG